MTYEHEIRKSITCEQTCIAFESFWVDFVIGDIEALLKLIVYGVWHSSLITTSGIPGVLVKYCIFDSISSFLIFFGVVEVPGTSSGQVTSVSDPVSCSSKQETQDVGVPRMTVFLFWYILFNVCDIIFERNSLVRFFVFFGVSSLSRTLKFGSDTNFGLSFRDLFNAPSDKVLSLLASDSYSSSKDSELAILLAKFFNTMFLWETSTLLSSVKRSFPLVFCKHALGREES